MSKLAVLVTYLELAVFIGVLRSGGGVVVVWWCWCGVGSWELGDGRWEVGGGQVGRAGRGVAVVFSVETGCDAIYLRLPIFTGVLGRLVMVVVMK